MPQVFTIVVLVYRTSAILKKFSHYTSRRGSDNDNNNHGPATGNKNLNLNQRRKLCEGNIVKMEVDDCDKEVRGIVCAQDSSEVKSKQEQNPLVTRGSRRVFEHFV